MSQRFSYVKYDESFARAQEAFKAEFEKVEGMLGVLPESRAKSLCLTRLEETYMWIGKALRDEQIKFGVISEHIGERG